MVNKMLNKKIIPGTALALLMALQIGCSAPDGQDDGERTGSTSPETTVESTSQDDEQKAAMDGFNSLTGGEAEASEAIGFIDENIGKVSQDNASLMLTKLEEIQKKELASLEEEFFADQAIQEGLGKIYAPDFDISKTDGIEDAELKALLEKTGKGGFKLETAEGMYFPVLDYAFYKKYSSYVTADIKDYIDIMAVESDNVPAKDAALVIDWNEIINRALSQENFIKVHSGSERLEAVKQLYGKYVSFALYGLNNTPLFSYDTKAMASEAKDAYTTAVENITDSDFGGIIKDYLEVLNKNGFKLTDEVENYRKGISEAIGG